MPPKRRRALSLPELLATNKHAVTVYFVLVHLADGGRQFSPSRNDIATIYPVSVKTVGRAIEALHDAAWINRAYGREGTRTWYRITLIKKGPELHLPGGTQRPTGRTRRVRPKKNPCGTSETLPPTEEGRPTASPTPVTGRVEAATQTQEEIKSMHPREREMWNQIAAGRNGDSTPPVRE